MKPLILGNGLLGSTLHELTNWHIISRSVNGFDFTKPKTYKKLIDNDKFDTIINCIAYTKTPDNTKNQHWKTNYVGTIHLVDLCNKFEKKLAHISTEYVYSQSPIYADEEQIPIHYNNWYTYTKVLSDAYVEARSNNFLTIRASFKPKPFPWPQAWIDLKGNFDYVDVIAKIIIKLVEGDAHGIFNVGTETKTMFDLAKQTRPDIQESHRGSLELPRDITMNLEKLDDFLSPK
jgi:dTDP-4-dehydrorhamnose reductase